MGASKIYLIILLQVSIFTLRYSFADVESNSCNQKTLNDSFVCVCDSKYCDTVNNPVLEEDTFCTYTTSRDKYRLYQKYGKVKYEECDEYDYKITVDSSVTYQTIHGFGGGMTDSAGINIMSLPKKARKKLLESYFGSNGIQYNMLRVPIGGSDFSTRAYAYAEHPRNDKTLSNFSLSYEDFNYKIPVILEAIQYAEEDIYIIGSSWSPPTWMKTNNRYNMLGGLKKEYYQTFADYLIKFVKQYEENGVKLWGITTGNEPFDGLSVMNVAPICYLNSLGWTPGDQADWIVDNLGPALRENCADLKLLAMDDQRIFLPLWMNVMYYHNKKCFDYIDGIGVHGYTDEAPAYLLDYTAKQFPDKFLISTEYSSGSLHNKVVLGNWHRAEHYAEDIIQNLNHMFTGWIDWNIALNEQGGPNWIENYVDAPVIVSGDEGVFYKQPTFYIMGHFSKFVLRDSLRIKSVLSDSSSFIKHVCFSRPDDTVVCSILNRSEEEVTITIEDKQMSTYITVECPAKSLKTVLYAS